MAEFNSAILSEVYVKAAESTDSTLATPVYGGIFVKIVDRLSRILNIGCYAAAGMMMLLTTADVFLRLAFKRPITGVTEVTENLMILLCLGMALAAVENFHIKVDVITNLLKKRARAIGEIIRQVIGLGVIVILVWQTFKSGLYAAQYQMSSSMLRIPTAPFYYILVASFAVLGIAMIAVIIKNVGVLRKWTP